MQITTLERLDRIPVGQPVYVQDQEWERVADGLTREGQTLPLVSFRAYAEAGRIRHGEGFAPGELPQWRHQGAHTYLIVGEEPGTDGYMTITFESGNFYNVETYPYTTMFGMREGPSAYTPTFDAWSRAMKAFTDRYMPVNFLGSGQAVASGGLIDALHAYAIEHPDLDALLAEHNVGRVRSGEVTVEAKGRAKVTADQFGNIEVDGEPEVGWKFRYDYPATASVTEPCLCSTFNEVFFKARLPQNLVSEEHKVTCSETDCVNKVPASAVA